MDTFIGPLLPVPFQWGVNDCLLFAANGCVACGGPDFAADFRGKYTDAGGALRTMHAVTGSTRMLPAAEVIAMRYGLRKRPDALTAQRGDVVLVEDAGRLICALVGQSGRWVHAPGDSGLRSICITATRHAWTY